MASAITEDPCKAKTDGNDPDRSDSKSEGKESTVGKMLPFLELVDVYLTKLSKILLNQTESTIDDVMRFLYIPYYLAHYGYREKKSHQKAQADFTDTYIVKFQTQTTREIISALIAICDQQDAEDIFELLALNLTGIQRLRKLVDNNLMSKTLMEYLRLNLKWYCQLLDRAESTPRVDPKIIEREESAPEQIYDNKLEFQLEPECDDASVQKTDDLNSTPAIKQEPQLKPKAETALNLAPVASLARKSDLEVEIQEMVNSDDLMRIGAQTVSKHLNIAYPKPWTLACILDAQRQMMMGAERYEGAEGVKRSTVKIEKLLHLTISQLNNDTDLTEWKLQHLGQAWCYLNHWEELNGDEHFRVLYRKNIQISKLFSAIVRKVMTIEENLNAFVPDIVNDEELSPLRFCVVVSIPLSRQQIYQCSDNLSTDQRFLQFEMHMSWLLPDYKLQNPKTMELIKLYMLPLHMKIVSHKSYEHNDIDYELSTALLRLVYWNGFVEMGNISNIVGVLDIWDALVQDAEMGMRRLHKLAKFMWVVIRRFDQQLYLNDSDLASNWRLASMVRERKNLIMTSLLPSVERLSNTLHQNIQSMDMENEDKQKTEHWMRNMSLSNLVTEYRATRKN